MAHPKLNRSKKFIEKIKLKIQKSSWWNLLNFLN